MALVGSALWLLGCGGRTSLVDPRRTVDAASMADDAGMQRVPKNHRSSGASCPQSRGPGSFPSGCQPNGATGPRIGNCVQDADCTVGTDGRCNLPPPIGPFLGCVGFCSYDDCFADSDCPSRVPCACRTSESVPAANVCLTTSNCRVDDDCGAGGYCSPSQVGAFCVCFSPALCKPDSGSCFAGTTPVACACGDSCGHGYFCHTPGDACIDDADCAGQGTCNYDTVSSRWTCSTCLAIP
jgi:hypothetical protein